MLIMYTNEDLVEGEIYYNKWKLIDLNTGERNKYGKVIIKIKCIDCNNEKMIPLYYIKKSIIKCEVCKQLELDSYIGQRFDRLTVISFSYKSNGSHYYYNCKCDCSNETVVNLSNLKSKQTRSCGCLAIENTIPGISPKNPLPNKIIGFIAP